MIAAPADCCTRVASAPAIQVGDDLENVAAPDDIDAVVTFLELLDDAAPNLNPLFQACGSDGELAPARVSSIVSIPMHCNPTA